MMCLFLHKMPRTVVLCLVYFTIRLSHIKPAKVLAYEPNKTSGS